MSKALRPLVAVAVLAVLLVGVPVLTWRAAGWPLPDEPPGWGEVTRRLRQGDLTGTTIVRALAVSVWIAWAQFVWALLWELVVNVRRDAAGRLARPAPLVAAPIGNGVAHLLSAVLAVGVIAAPIPATSLTIPPTAAPPSPADVPAAPPVAPAVARVAGGWGVPAPAAAPTWIADRHDTMWAIAERTLGDGSGVERLLALNPHLTPGHTFHDGEPVQLPDDAEVPADRRADGNRGAAARGADAPARGPEPTYEVRAGDGLWDVAAALLGDGSRYPELVPLLLGQEVAPGVTFRCADQTIHPGWVFRLPPASHAGEVTVRPGETLSSIAARELGDPARWPEIWAGNRHEIMDDGRSFDDPDLIIPGWTLDLEPDTVASAPGAPTDDAGDEGAVDGDAAPDGAARDADDRADEDGSREEPAPTTTSPPPPVEGSGPRPSPDGGSTGADGTEPARDWVNVWETVIADEVEDRRLDHGTAGERSDETVASDDPTEASSSESVELLTFDRAAMLSAGILALLGVRRRSRLRRAPTRSTLVARSPGPVSTERALRAVDAGERLARVEVAVRAVASAHVEAGERVLAVVVSTDGEVEVVASGPVRLPLPWTGDATTWVLPGITPLEVVAPEARRCGAPCPLLVQLGTTADARDVFVDLEAIEAIEIAGPRSAADAIVASVATSLAASVMAEVASLVTVGVPSAALLDHRHHAVAVDERHAFELAVDAVGSTRSHRRSTFELRALGTGGEQWEPAAVLIDSSAERVEPPADRRAIAVVSSAPIHGPSSRLAPVRGSTQWELLPLGVRFTPIGLSADDIAEIAALTAVSPPDAPELAAAVPSDTAAPIESSGRPWDVLVTTFGRVAAMDAEGREARIERSKATELLAWLVTHRSRSTRSSARAAMWDFDVRDATFANVVSEARRSLARLVDPPDGGEWIDRTLTDRLPLHDRVWSDGDVLEHALALARVQPPAQAIATLRPAVDLVDGMPFAGTSYLWPDAEGITSQFVLLATSATSELAAHCLSLGDVDGVFAATARGLRVLPGHEELVGLRMRAHAVAGDHAGVRAVWESYERVIVADPWSDGEPSSELVELRRSLLRA